MTPALKLLPGVRWVAVPSVTSTLPPPMSMTTAVAAADVHAVPGGQMDQPGLFRPGNHADPDAGLTIDLGDEIAAVVSLPCRARRRRDNLVDLVRVGEAAELGQGLERGGHGGRGQAAAVEAAGAEPDHVLFAVDDLEGQVRPDLDHNHVDGVGSDVDGGNAHEGGRQLSRSGTR